MTRRKGQGAIAPPSVGPNPDRDRIGGFVRNRREARGLSQAQVAELAGVGIRAVSELERGKPTLRMDVANAVLGVFGKTLGVVDVGREEPKA